MKNHQGVLRSYVGAAVLLRRSNGKGGRAWVDVSGTAGFLTCKNPR